MRFFAPIEESSLTAALNSIGVLSEKLLSFMYPISAVSIKAASTEGRGIIPRFIVWVVFFLEIVEYVVTFTVEPIFPLSNLKTA